MVVMINGISQWLPKEAGIEDGYYSHKGNQYKHGWVVQDQGSIRTARPPTPAAQVSLPWLQQIGTNPYPYLPLGIHTYHIGDPKSP
ncbi:hypothetical protein G9A89_000697 [Geosiphon pyriformis]|nr:hypothetical protein G9A89_000697 [Geosiphon pyriformis]